MKLSEQDIELSTNVNLARFMAAIAVIISHSYYIAQNKLDCVSILSNEQVSLGGIAVAVFFFYSGFYVTKSLGRAESIKKFLLKRCERIFPALWFVVTICALCLGSIITSIPLKEYFLCADTYKYFFNACLIPVHNLPGVFDNNVYGSVVNGALWTLPIEFASYIMLAIIDIISEKRNSMRRIIHVFVLVVFLILLFIVDIVLKQEMLISIVRAIVFFENGVLYYDFKDRITLDINVALVSLGALIVMLMLGVPGFNWVFIIAFPYVIATLSLAIVQFPFNLGLFNISYEMYLVGFPLQQLVTHFWGGKMPIVINDLIVMPLDIVLAYIIYKVVQTGKDIVVKG